MSKNYVTISSIAEQIRNKMKNQAIAGIDEYKCFNYNEKQQIISYKTIETILNRYLPANPGYINNNIINTMAKYIILKDLQPFAYRKANNVTYAYNFTNFINGKQTLPMLNEHFIAINSLEDLTDYTAQYELYDMSTLYAYAITGPFKNVHKLFDLDTIFKELNVTDSKVIDKIKQDYKSSEYETEFAWDADPDILKQAAKHLPENAVMRYTKNILNAPDITKINNLQLVNKYVNY